MRQAFIALAALTLSACGEAETRLNDITTQLSDLGGQAVESATGVVGTKTACMLTGATTEFCGCIEEQFGPQITAEELQAITDLTREPAQQPAQTDGAATTTSASAAAPTNAQTRQAIMQCTARNAVQSAISSEAN